MTALLYMIVTEWIYLQLTIITSFFTIFPFCISRTLISLDAKLSQAQQQDFFCYHPAACVVGHAPTLFTGHTFYPEATLETSIHSH